MIRCVCACRRSAIRRGLLPHLESFGSRRDDHVRWHVVSLPGDVRRGGQPGRPRGSGGSGRGWRRRRGHSGSRERCRSERRKRPGWWKRWRRISGGSKRRAGRSRWRRRCRARRSRELRPRRGEKRRERHGRHRRRCRIPRPGDCARPRRRGSARRPRRRCRSRRSPGRGDARSRAIWRARLTGECVRRPRRHLAGIWRRWQCNRHVAHHDDLRWEDRSARRRERRRRRLGVRRESGPGSGRQRGRSRERRGLWKRLGSSARRCTRRRRR